MPFQALKKYIIQNLKPSDKEKEQEVFNFQNSFSESLGRETSHEEAVILLLALVPHILPHFFDEVINEIYPKGGELPEFGGVRDGNHRGLQPTGETAQYILAKDEINYRLQIFQLFNKNHWFHKDQILYLEAVKEGEPFMSGRLFLSQNAVSLLFFGESISPELSLNFPAQKITTKLEWQDLILPEKTKEKIDEILEWEKNKKTILNDWKQSKFIKNGYRALFFGPSGTGKTLTASLLGKELSRIKNKNIEVYRVDLSMIVSKYIGETEKNLENLFKKAENKEWILFFDEGEHFFSSRTSIRDAHDKYANQEVSYLLQRIEEYNGIIIVATNLKTNMDSAFARRFQTMVEFKKPDAKERKLIWENTLPGEDLVQREEDLVNQLIEYPVTGGNILNAIHYACLKTSIEKPAIINIKDCIEGIRRELEKEGKTL